MTDSREQAELAVAKIQSPALAADKLWWVYTCASIKREKEWLTSAGKALTLTEEGEKERQREGKVGGYGVERKGGCKK